MKSKQKLITIMCSMLAVLLLITACTSATPTPLAPGGEHPEVPAVIRQAIAEQLNIDIADLEIEQVELVDWPDACLGLATEDQLCAQVITPGYQVFLDVNNTRYEYRTDESGDLVVLATAPQEPVDNPIIIWSFSDENGCQMAHISEQAVAAGPCNGPLLPGRFVSPDRQARLTGLATKFAAFQVETQAGEISFNGQGQITATPSQQRMIAEWSRLVVQESISGRSGASWGLVFTWDREGGIAGFCDHLEVFASGEAYASNCKATAGDPQGQVQLNDSQLRALYGWLDNYTSFEYEQSDPATADSMTTRIVFFGSGNIEASEGEILAIQELAAELFAQATTVQNPADLHGAIQALSSYLSLLNDGQYSEAVQYFAGSTVELAYFNPEMDPNDTAGLFEAACTINGFVCLPVLNVADQAQVSAIDFIITVELQDRDGGPFVFGPCCGADPALEPPQTQFVFTVRKVDGRFLVQETPLYVP
jgi:hypothetical protein